MLDPSTGWVLMLLSFSSSLHLMLIDNSQSLIIDRASSRVIAGESLPCPGDTLDNLAFTVFPSEYSEMDEIFGHLVNPKSIVRPPPPTV
ncbi:hypothetical protein pCPXV0293 [Cowpox virus]|uniref:Uncharacterized protein n=1 Tax=Cowpox virus TaxID=10243 RepID=A0A212PP37_COWPX|nr:hypothetical protein pCPXV0293 [Cowpox virus]SNB48687.1 hypothetical protein pCPXV0293 [Cowpox virus]